MTSDSSGAITGHGYEHTTTTADPAAKAWGAAQVVSALFQRNARTVSVLGRSQFRAV
jgi:hypothetical protein